jgi:hypothetical protein
MSLGDFRAYATVALLGLIFAALFGLLATLAIAAVMRRLTGHDNAVTRYFDGWPRNS